MRRFLLVATVLLATGCAEKAQPPTGVGGTRGVSSTGNPVDTTAVSIGDNAFSPSSVTIKVGGVVTWTWTGSNQHNVTWTDSTVAPSPTQTAGTYSRTFTVAGTFTYSCTVHGETGSVVVQ